MKPKDRVLQSLEHRDAGRVPLDCWATDEAISRLCQFFSTDEGGVLKKLNIDMRYIGFDTKNAYFEKQKDGSFQRRIDTDIFEDIWGVKRKRISTGKSTYLELVQSPLGEVENITAIERFSFPSLLDFDIEKDRLSLARDYAVVFTGDRLCMRTSFFKLAMYLRGFENFLLDLVINKVMAEAIINRLSEFHHEITENIFKKYSDSIDIFLMGDDFGTQTGPLIGLDTFRYFFKNPLKKMIDLCHRYNIKTMLHSCGSIKIFIPDLIEIGLDILNPVQHTAAEMDLVELKKAFGNDICFHGAVDVQNVLPFGGEEEIKNEVKKCIEALGKNGGYICAPSHNIQADVPVESILIMYETAAAL